MKIVWSVENKFTFLVNSVWNSRCNITNNSSQNWISKNVCSVEIKFLLGKVDPFHFLLMLEMKKKYFWSLSIFWPFDNFKLQWSKKRERKKLPSTLRSIYLIICFQRFYWMDDNLKKRCSCKNVWKKLPFLSFSEKVYFLA